MTETTATTDEKITPVHDSKEEEEDAVEEEEQEEVEEETQEAERTIHKHNSMKETTGKQEINEE